MAVEEGGGRWKPMVGEATVTGEVTDGDGRSYSGRQSVQRWQASDRVSLLVSFIGLSVGRGVLG